MRESAKNLFILVILEVLTVFEAAKAILQATGVLHSNNVVFAITGSFRNPGPLGGFIAMGMSAACAYLAINRRWNNLNFNRKLIYLLSVATFSLGVIILPATMSRAGWLAFGVAAIILAFKELKLGKWLMSHKTVTFFSAIIVLSLCLLAFKLKPDSALGRIHIWHMECRSIAEKPWAGHGNVLGAYGATQARYFMEKERSETIVQLAGSPEYAFNEYLKAGVERGLPAMVFFFSITVTAIVILDRKNSPLAYALIALSVFAFFSYPLSLWQFVLVIGLILCSVVDGMAVVIACTSVAIMLAPGARERMEAEKTWKAMKSYTLSESYAEQAEELKHLHAQLRKNYRYLYDLGYALHRSGNYAESNVFLSEGAAISADPMFHDIMGKNYEALEEYDEAEREYTLAHYMVPCRLYPHILLMEMHVRLGQRELAIQQARHALALPVRSGHIAMEGLHERAKACLDSLIAHAP